MVRAVREKSSSSTVGLLREMARTREGRVLCDSPPDATGELRSPARLAGLMEHIDDLAFILFNLFSRRSTR